MPDTRKGDGLEVLELAGIGDAAEIGDDAMNGAGRLRK
jgi:hypothetical protein